MTNRHLLKTIIKKRKQKVNTWKNLTWFLYRWRFFQLIQFSVPPHWGQNTIKACRFLFGTASWLFVDTHSGTDSGWPRLGCCTGFIQKVKIRLFLGSAETIFLFPFKWNKHIGYRKLWFVLELFVFCIPFNFARWDLLSARTHPVKIHKAAVFFTTITLEKLYNDSRRWDPLLALEEMQIYGLVTSNCWEIFLSLTIDE